MNALVRIGEHLDAAVKTTSMKDVPADDLLAWRRSACSLEDFAKTLKKRIADEVKRRGGAEGFFLSTPKPTVEIDALVLSEVIDATKEELQDILRVSIEALKAWCANHAQSFDDVIALCEAKGGLFVGTASVRVREDRNHAPEARNGE